MTKMVISHKDEVMRKATRMRLVGFHGGSVSRVAYLWIVLAIGLLILAIGAVVLYRSNAVSSLTSLSAVASGQNSAAISQQPKKHLYSITQIYDAPDSTWPIGGRVTVQDLATQRDIFSIKTGYDAEVVPSPDGSRLYIAARNYPSEAD